MPGLVGFVDLPGSHEQLNQLLSRMLASLQTETWHKAAGRVLGAAALGRTSLEIFTPGDQPVGAPARSIWVLLDGEVHNLTALATSAGLRHQASEPQAELVLRLYQARAERFICDLNGSFNVVIWDAGTGKLLIANDRFGSRPLYYARPQSGGLGFSSEIKSLLLLPGITRTPNLEAAIEFFTFRHLLGDKTPFLGVHWLPPATILSYQAGSVSLSSYWLPPFDQQDDRITLGGYAEQLLQRLRAAMHRCLERETPVGILLSGGLDSRLLVGAASGHRPLRTFTRGMAGCDDASLAQQVAARAGTHHQFLEIAPDFLQHHARRGVWLTDGLMTCIDFYELSTLNQLKQQVDIVCFGIPAGPLGGLGVSSALSGLDDGRLAQALYGMRARLIDDTLQQDLLAARFIRQTRGLALDNLRAVLGQLPRLPSELRAQHFFLRQYGPRSALYGPVLTRSQAETCFPFADADLLDLVCRVPGKLRAGRRVEIEMLRQAAPGLAEVPWQFSGLPAAISTPGRVRLQRALYRLRREVSQRTFGLIPSAARREQVNWPGWFRTVLRPWLEDTLLGERTLARGYFNPEGIRRLVDAHMSGTRDHSRQFGPLLTFELWNRLFVDGETP